MDFLDFELLAEKLVKADVFSASEDAFSLIEITKKMIPALIQQGCPKSGPRAKCGPWSNFIRPTPSVIEYISKKIEIKKQM